MGTRATNGRFVKGLSGNPGGRRPSAVSITAQLRLLGERTLPDGQTRAVALAEGYWDRALNSPDEKIRADASDRILDRLEGKSVARTENADAGTWTDVSVSDVPAERVRAAYEILRGGRAEQA